MIRLSSLLLLVCLSSFPFRCDAQKGVSSLAMGAARAGISRINAHGGYMMPAPDMLRVEEFINFHRHDIPTPGDGIRVRLDIQQLPLAGGDMIYQFGIATPQDLDPSKFPPLNFVLVIDRSGSMSGDKLANVKKSIRTFIERFRESDRVSIVGFSNDAMVHLQACEKTEYRRIAQALDSIHAGGGTNLHAGLMLGYSEALKNYDPERTNRVIFLTDGNANIGVTESEEIARQSKACNDKGISLSTIGLGVDFNHGLLRQLADAGRGLIHFVGDDRDIEKTFITEIDSLLAPAARQVRLEIDFGSSTSSPKIFGYRPVCHGSKYRFELDDLNHGATQIVLTRISANRHVADITATLSYIDAVTNQETVLIQTPEESVSLDQSRQGIRNNYAIALVAQSLRSAAVASQEGDCRKAEQRLKKGIDRALRQVDDLPDKDTLRVLKIARNYRKEILDCIASRGD